MYSRSFHEFTFQYFHLHITLYAALSRQHQIIFPILTSTMAKKIKNNGDWYLADIVERAEMAGDDKTDPNRRCLNWVNSILVQAPSIEKAYDKAIKIGRNNYSIRYETASGRICNWKVLGLSSLAPIFEDIEDGAELTYVNKGHIAAKTSNALVRTKREILSEFK